MVDWRAGGLIALAAAAAVAVMVRLRSVAVPAHDAEREVNARLYGDLEERLGGLEDLRGNGAGPYAVHKLQEHSWHWWHAARRAAFAGDSAYAVAGSAFTIGAVLTLGLGVWLNRAGQMTIGSTLALFRFSQMIREPIERMAEQIRELQKAAAGARRAARLLAARPTVVDGPGTPLPAGPLAVDLEGVGLVYESGQRALDGVDLHLAPGTTLGVVGRTGSGKTSLGRMLTRLWDVSDGAVRLGGVDVRDTTDGDLRRRVAVVSQEVELLDAPLRDNLTLFDAVSASDEDITAALGAVGLGAWATGLPDGLDTVLDGRALSAGEAQLLAFARVLLTDAGLVLLDEATSRLDPATEARLARATATALAGRTAVVIAHRLTTLDHLDEICVVHAGRIVEHGARVALAADPGSRYARLLATSTATAAAAPTADDLVTTVTDGGSGGSAAHGASDDGDERVA
jgi:ABC-type multidrug transport system fused ATPase/permease subunit